MIMNNFSYEQVFSNHMEFEIIAKNVWNHLKYVKDNTFKKNDVNYAKCIHWNASSNLSYLIRQTFSRPPEYSLIASFL